MKEIKLTRGFVALVDDEDFEFLNQWKWRANGHGDWQYAIRNFSLGGGKKKIVKMHRQILGITDSKILCDHRDGDRLNNQKSNLRIATQSQNNANRKGIGVSGYLGVFKSGNKWMARIRQPKKDRKYLGTFDTKEQAALAYNMAAIEVHGEFANLNKV